MDNFEKKNAEDMKFLDKDSYTWRLYHSVKNENALIPVIVMSIMTLFLHDGILISICIWILYFLYCKANNEALNKDPIVLKEREQAKKAYIKSVQYLNRLEKIKENKENKSNEKE